MECRALALCIIFGMTGCSPPGTPGVRTVLSPTPPPPSDFANTSGPDTGPVGANPRRPAPVEQLGQAETPIAIGRAGSAGPVLPVVSGDRQVQLDYVNADVPRVAREVLGDILGLSVTIDPDVQGTVTLRTLGRIPIAEVPRRLDEALRPLGFAISAVGAQVRVARLADLQTSQGGETRLISLNNSAVADLMPVLRQTLPQSVQIEPDPLGRGLIATGPADALDALQNLVGLFDVDTLRSRSFGLYPLTGATPQSVVAELSIIYANSGVRFAAIDRLNAVLVVANRPAALAQIRQAIAKLDSEARAVANVHVYPLHFRRAAELADVLNRAYGGTPSSARPTNPAGPFAGLQLGSAAGTANSLPVAPPGNASLPNSNANAGATQQTASQQPLTSADLGLTGPVRVEADAGRNSLLVMATPADYETIEATIRRLDVRPRQVFLEGVVAEVKLTDALSYGVNTSIRIGDSTIDQGNPAAAVLQAVADGGLTYVLRSHSVTSVIQALSTITTVKVVSAPRVLVLDNETATLQVGEQVPILVQSATSTQDPGAPLVNTVELRDTGVILSIRARVGQGGDVSLDIFQEVSTAVPTTVSSLTTTPTIRVRRLQSSVDVQTGDTVALGGLMQDQTTTNKSGIPFLNTLPIVGALFGTTEQSVSRSEILILLTPRIVESTADINDVTNELKDKLGVLAPDVARAVAPPRPPQPIPLALPNAGASSQ